MIAAVTLRLLCLIFQQVLGLVLLMVPQPPPKISMAVAGRPRGQST